MRHGAAARRMRNRSGGGGQQQQHHQHQHGNRRSFQNKNRVFDSNGPDVRIRGTAFQIVEKYQALAKDAAAAGDRVVAESYLQHAEHYQRIIVSWVDEEAAWERDHGQSVETNTNPYDIPPPAGTSPQPTIETEDLGLPASILGGAPGEAKVEQRTHGRTSETVDV